MCHLFLEVCITRVYVRFKKENKGENGTRTLGHQVSPRDETISGSRTATERGEDPDRRRRRDSNEE